MVGGRKVARRLVLAMALALSAACSGGPYGRDTTAGSSTPAAEATGSSAPAPARIVGGKEDGFAIQIPAGWTDIRIDDATLQRLFDRKQPFDEGIANQIRILAGRNGKLLAFEDAHRTTNLNVLKVPATPGTTTESLVKDLPGQLAQLGLKDVVVEQVTLASGPAARASGTKPAAGSGGPAKDLFQLQYYALSGSDTFICVLASDEPGRDRARLEAIGQTFTLVH
jgi:hypothetical protein